MVVGETPFEGENLFVVMNARVTGDPVAPRKRNPEVSKQIEEIILQQAVYCGVPAANHAFKEAGEIVKEVGRA